MLGSSYCTSPRRTSSMAITVGFLEVVGRTLRAPFWSWRARLAATMMNRYALASGSSGIMLCAVCLKLVSGMCFESLQNRADFKFHPLAAATHGENDGNQILHGRFYFAVHQHVIVLLIVSDLFGSFAQSPVDYFSGILAAGAQTLFQNLPARRQNK